MSPLTTARANKLACNFLAKDRQLLELESCLNPLRVYGFSKSSSQNRKKQFSVSVGGFLEVTSQRTKRTCFRNFRHLWPVL